MSSRIDRILDRTLAFLRRSDIAPHRIHMFAYLEQMDEYRAKLVSFGARVRRGVQGAPQAARRHHAPLLSGDPHLRVGRRHRYLDRLPGARPLGLEVVVPASVRLAPAGDDDDFLVLRCLGRLRVPVRHEGEQLVYVAIIGRAPAGGSAAIRL